MPWSHLQGRRRPHRLRSAAGAGSDLTLEDLTEDDDLPELPKQNFFPRIHGKKMLNWVAWDANKRHGRGSTSRATSPSDDTTMRTAVQRYDPTDREGFTRRWRYLQWGAWTDFRNAAGTTTPWHWTPHMTQRWVHLMSEVDEEMIISLAQQINEVDELKITIANVRPEWPGWQPAWATEDHPAQEQFEYPALRCVRIADDLDWERNR